MRAGSALKTAIERYYNTEGIDLNAFIQEALTDRFEELADFATCPVFVEMPNAAIRMCSKI